MTLRIAIGKLTTLVVPWSAQEAAELAQASLSRTRAYLSHLVKHGVVVPAGTDLWRAGPRAQVWRAQPAPDGPSYGNSADYRRQRDTFDKIKLRDWNARRAGAKEPTEAVASGLAGLASLTCQEVSRATIDGQEVSTMQLTELLSLNEVVRILDVSMSTLRRMVAAGEIRTILVRSRCRRISAKEIEDYQRRCASGAVHAG